MASSSSPEAGGTRLRSDRLSASCRQACQRSAAGTGSPHANRGREREERKRSGRSSAARRPSRPRSRASGTPQQRLAAKPEPCSSATKEGASTFNYLLSISNVSVRAALALR